MGKDAYTLRLDRPLDREAVRLIRSQTNRARRALKAPDDTGVHTARKAIKRARAALRLVRGSVPRDRYRELDRALRTIGRRLAPVRDAAVALELVDTLRAEGALKKKIAAGLQTYLEALRAEARDALSEETIEALRAELGALWLGRDEVAGIGAHALHAGLAQTYIRGRERLAEAIARPRADEFHAWRRQVKHLGYQLRLFAPAWPLVLRPTARAFDTLAEALGDEHDLAELARLAKEAGLDKKALRSVQQATLKRRKALQAEAWPLGARLYAEEGGAFAGRLMVYLASALAEAHDAPVHPLDGLALPAPPTDRLHLS